MKRKIRQVFYKAFIRWSIPMLIKAEFLIAFCKWSKEAEWRNGTKQMFIKDDWESYIAEFLKHK